MRSGRFAVAWLAALAVAGTAVAAPVMCEKKSGVVVVRDPACKKKELVLDLSHFGMIGPKGDKGDPGPLLTTLTSGATLIGNFALGATAAAGGDVAETALAFPFPLGTDPVVNVMRVGDPVAAGCSGSSSAPGAAPGNLCIFFGWESSNIADAGTYSPEDGFYTAYKHGAVVFIHSTAAGLFEAAGTWAVTAP